ncbi:MAG: sodium-translocating pyrophosphatase [Defluviitaleaceae bacterium]|nr:sodium-translocating pyrophosphatase [Defluviitaleaceae bacterium]MCL2274784.1 sodium-translocating pyrophosphatase [Defluviitaleaceae bacterium]
MDFQLAFLIGVGGALIALCFAFLQNRKVMKFSEGTPAMQKIANAIRKGAGAYLSRQLRVVSVVYVVVVAALVLLAALGHASPFIPVAFLTGGILSQLSAFIGMKIATRANVRTAAAAGESLNQGLKVAFASGTVLSFTVVGLSILDVSIWFLVLRFVFDLPAREIAENMVMFGVGVAVFALFARVGGGIFTKAADVGADLVGKVEAGIPEDDPRNPATIADNVGDNVGDVAGMGADLYESYIKAMHAGIALGFAAFGSSDLVWAAMFLPVGIAVVGMFASLVGTFLIRTGENATQAQLLGTLRKGTYTAAGLATVASIPIVLFVMRDFNGHWGLIISIFVGVLAGTLIAYFTEYFTSTHYKPTKDLAAASETGAATIIIGGISLGMKSTVAPIAIVVGAIVASFLASGGQMGDFYIYRALINGSEAGTADAFSHGLFGIGLAAVGMLSTLGITLATDAYGPVADNAGGIAEMAHMDPEVRDRTDALDALGNTTAATGKGFAVGSAALTSLALLVSYIKIATDYVAYHGGYTGGILGGDLIGFEYVQVGGQTHRVYDFVGLDLSLNNPSVLIGMFLGVMLVFIFSALTMSAVQKAAQNIVKEVRRQFREIKGIMEGTTDPDYEACVDLCTRGALREMVAPTLSAIVLPIVTGLIWGVEGVVGFIGGATVMGFVLAVFMNNAGGAWDNAKKYIEAGNHGGKGSDCHKAAVIGDTVGDPFKDTSGPSMNTMFKLVSTVSITVVSIIAAFSLF